MIFMVAPNMARLLMMAEIRMKLPLLIEIFQIGFEVLIECQTNTSCLVSCLLVTYPGGPNYWEMTCDDLFMGLHKNVELKGVTKISQEC